MNFPFLFNPSGDPTHLIIQDFAIIMVVAAASLAIAMAKKYGASIHLLHVVHVEQVLRVTGIHASSASYSEEVDKHVTAAKMEADKWFERIDNEAQDQFVKIAAADVRGTSFSIVGEIVDYAEKNKT